MENQQRQRRLHIRHAVIVITLISITVIFGTILCFGLHIPTTFAYSDVSGASQSLSSAHSQGLSAPSSANVSSVSTQSGFEANSQTPSVPSSNSGTSPETDAPKFAYQASYPNLYVPPVQKVPYKAGDKVVYLTFDDGPSNLTEPLLSILDQYKVKATFFVMAQGKSKENCAAWMKEIVNRGHAIALHTYSHNYRQVYASPQAFLDDFAKMSDFIEQSTGQKITMFRFPGGSVNSYNKKDCKEIIQEMTRRGYTYYDWNVSSGDGTSGTTAADVYRNVIRGVHQHNASIVLMHNSAAKKPTLSQIANIIAALQKEGYRFDKLNPSVMPFNFKVPK